MPDERRKHYLQAIQRAFRAKYAQAEGKPLDEARTQQLEADLHELRKISGAEALDLVVSLYRSGVLVAR